MKKVFLLLILINGVLTSCHKEEDNLTLKKDNYFIFGNFYGECIGKNCVKTYKLTENKLFEDTIDDYSHKRFSFVELEELKFNDVKDLWDCFPNKILSEDRTVLGCPDCHDQGGIFIQYYNNNKLRSWKIDNDKKSVPIYLHHFIDKVNEKIEQINSLGVTKNRIEK